MSLGNIAGALSGLAQGFVQGRQLRDQEQMQHEELQSSKLSNAMQVFGLLSQMGQSANPEFFNSPAVQKFANNTLGQAGIPMPKNAQGGIDINAFRKPLSSFATSPQYQDFLRLPKGSPERAAMLQQYGGNDQDKQNLVNMDQVYSPAEQDSAASTLRLLTSMVANGTVDAKNPGQAFLDQYNSAADIAGRPHWGGVTVGQKTLGQEAKTQEQTDLLALQKKYFPQLKEAQIQNIMARTGLTIEQMKAIPQRIAQGWKKIDISSQRADDAHKKFLDDQSFFDQLGVTPAALGHYASLVNSSQNSMNQDRIAASDAQKALRAIEVENGNKPPQTVFDPKQNKFVPVPGLTDKDATFAAIYADAQNRYNNLNGRYQNDVMQFQGLSKGRAAFAQKVQQMTLKRSGAPGSWKTTDNSSTSQKPKGRPVATLHGKPIFLSADGSHYVYADGSPAN